MAGLTLTSSEEPQRPRATHHPSQCSIPDSEVARPDMEGGEYGKFCRKERSVLKTSPFSWMRYGQAPVASLSRRALMRGKGYFQTSTAAAFSRRSLV